MSDRTLTRASGLRRRLVAEGDREFQDGPWAMGQEHHFSLPRSFQQKSLGSWDSGIWVGQPGTRSLQCHTWFYAHGEMSDKAQCKERKRRTSNPAIAKIMKARDSRRHDRDAAASDQGRKWASLAVQGRSHEMQSIIVIDTSALANQECPSERNAGVYKNNIPKIARDDWSDWDGMIGT